MMVSGLFNIPTPQKKSQKKNSAIRSVPKPAKPTVLSSVTRKAQAKLSSASTKASTVNPKKDRANELISHLLLESPFINPNISLNHEPKG
jgi:hypothetical protein